MTAPCHGVRRRERGSCEGSSGRRAASASRIASLASSRATNVLCPKPQLQNQTFAKSGTHPRLRLSVKPWQSEARTNRDSPDAGHAPGPALQLHRVGDIPSINKMVLKACASVAQLVKSSLPNKSDGHKALPQKDPSSMDPYSHSLAPTTHSAASRAPIGSRRKGHRSIEYFPPLS